MGSGESYISGNGEDIGNVEDDCDTVYNLEDNEEEYKDVDLLDLELVHYCITMEGELLYCEWWKEIREGNGQGIASTASLPIYTIAVDSVEKECGGDGDDQQDDRSIGMMIYEKIRLVDCWIWAIMRGKWAWVTHCIAV